MFGHVVSWKIQQVTEFQKNDQRLRESAAFVEILCIEHVSDNQAGIEVCTLLYLVCVHTIAAQGIFHTEVSAVAKQS